ncbi:transposable element Tcb2 transposase [Trichonephila clavipes]|nr:transposable element Tcb2 transposase [Trichonephila clavipes]
MAYDSRSTLIVMRGTLTGQRYVDNILRPHVGPFLNGLPGAIFQQDNARPHTARVAQDFFQTLPLPARCPDLSPGERPFGDVNPSITSRMWNRYQNEEHMYHKDLIGVQPPSTTVLRPCMKFICIPNGHGFVLAAIDIVSQKESSYRRLWITSIEHYSNVLEGRLDLETFRSENEYLSHHTKTIVVAWRLLLVDIDITPPHYPLASDSASERYHIRGERASSNASIAALFQHRIENPRFVGSNNVFSSIRNLLIFQGNLSRPVDARAFGQESGF